MPPIPRLNSIQTADKIFATQTRPVLIGCDDGLDYVCKYGSGSGFAARLFCEYLGGEFARCWDIQTPDAAFVRINPVHIPPDYSISGISFEQDAFGSRYSRSYAELTQINTLKIPSKFKSTDFKRTLLKVGLFDCWLANEDRTPNNFNLMFDLEQDYRLVAIDNEGIFNSRVFEQPIFQLNENDSILLSPFSAELFSKQDVATPTINEFKEILYLCSRNCEQNVTNILSQVPDNWNVDVSLVKRKLGEVFSEAWKSETLKTFQTFLQLLLNKL